jgi:AcrR family transcriptional regulator
MPPSTDLRERQREATHDQILRAVHELLIDEHPASLSMPRVAERAGTSLRTLYRYFPTKEALLDAASLSFETPASVVGGRIDLDTLPEYLRASWRAFTESIAAVRSQHLTPAGRSLRERRTPRNRKLVAAAIEDEGIDVDPRVVDLLLALTSSSMYLELCDRLGHDDQEAADLAAWTVGAVLDRIRREGGIR